MATVWLKLFEDIQPISAAIAGTQTVEQAHRMLAAGKSSEEVIDYLAHTLTNRLLHSPTHALRQASESADPALAQALIRLLVEERDRR